MAILCTDTDAELMGPGGTRSRVATRVVVGMADGQWRQDGRLGWALDGAKSVLVRGVGSQPRAFLTALKAATARAAQEKAPMLTVCRNCQELVGPELRRDDLCLRCEPTHEAVPRALLYAT
ncbi:MAG: hypothetical protein WCP95_11080 [Actinomycetes bacterium]